LGDAAHLTDARRVVKSSPFRPDEVL
jgi:hypothetical protein